jgi:predicted Zn-dependent protease
MEVYWMAGRIPALAASIDINQATQRADVLLQSKALLAAGRAQDVAGRLSTWVANNPKDGAAWQLLAVAYGNQNQLVRAIRADAESHVAQLDYPAALDRLKAAQNMMRSNPASSDFMEASIIDVRTRQVNLLVREQADQDKLDR